MDISSLINISTISFVLMIVGALGVILLTKPLDKIIMFSVLDAGFLLAVVTFKILDVAFAIALLEPLSIIVFLLSIIKINEIRKGKQGDLND